MKKVFLPWASELNYQKCVDTIGQLKIYSWVSSNWWPVVQLRHKKNGTSLSHYKKEYDTTLYEKISEEDHSHCELCWTSISNFEGEEHSGYRNTEESNPSAWVCNQCYAKILQASDPLGALKKYTKEIEAVDIVLEGNSFNNLSGFYNEIEKKFTHQLDWEIGRNLDALNDVLRGGFGVHGYGEPVNLCWRNSDKSKNDLGWSETVRYLEKQMNSAHRKNKELLKQEIQQAKRKEGQTLFDRIEALILQHDFISLKLD